MNTQLLRQKPTDLLFLSGENSNSRIMNNEKIKRQQDIFYTWRRFDDLSTFFAIVGLLITIGSFEQDVRLFRTTEVIPEGKTINDMDAMKTPRFLAWYSAVFKWITFITTILTIICMFMRRHYKIKWINNFINDKVDNVMTYGPLFQEYNKIILGLKNEELSRSNSVSDTLKSKA